MACDHSLQTQAYLDGELDAAQSLEAEAHLEICEDCQAQAAGHADLKTAIAGASYHRASPHLRARIGAALDGESKIIPLQAPRKKDRFWLGAGSGAGGMAIAAALAFFLFLPANEMVIGDLAEAHQRSLVSEHLIDVASSD